jgi:hypothetical protein
MFMFAGAREANKKVQAGAMEGIDYANVREYTLKPLVCTVY